MPNWRAIWDLQYLGNSVGAWAIAVAAFLLTFTVLPVVKTFMAARRRKWQEAGRTHPLAVELTALLIARTSRVFLWIVALWFASTLLYIPSRIDRIIYITVVFGFWFQVGLWAMAAVRYAIERRGRRAGTATAAPVQSGSIDIIVFIAGLTIWAMAFLLALDNLGVQIKPLLTGLGIGGVAVALAVQSVLGDVLASMSIALDKPFGIGDSLAVDDIQGTVEHIGVKSTRLRSISGEQIILANADVLKARVRNYGRMRERRSAFRLNVTYDTPAEKLRQIPAAVRAVIEAEPQTRFDRCHFLAFGEWALQFEVVYFVTVSDYKTYADLQQTINLGILERFAALGVEIAFATHSLHTPGGSVARKAN
ncbi:MAG TPA: mechanosensitive ion channel family protein [Steroidobacteraceae bacterium]|jgi:small-conductance mechanosensitive channel|nr:mechanosensitive ion channel family protein [Steroidobacteraceae bacterium]